MLAWNRQIFIHWKFLSHALKLIEIAWRFRSSHSATTISSIGHYSTQFPLKLEACGLGESPSRHLPAFCRPAVARLSQRNSLELPTRGKPSGRANPRATFRLRLS